MILMVDIQKKIRQCTICGDSLHTRSGMYLCNRERRRHITFYSNGADRANEIVLGGELRFHFILQNEAWKDLNSGRRHSEEDVLSLINVKN